MYVWNNPSSYKIVFCVSNPLLQMLQTLPLLSFLLHSALDVCIKTIQHNWVVELSKLAQVMKLLISVCDVPNLNFSKNTDWPNGVFLWVFLVPPAR
jgi:hypothetical protein